jgi:hypothetical protein
VSDLFQLPVGKSQAASGSPFEKFGLAENPFPAAGIDSGTFYRDHMLDELRRVNDWLHDVSTATAADPPKPVRPLALFGSLGVGKTHLLRYLERGLKASGKSPVLCKALADEGMTRILLANLLLRYMPTPASGGADDREPGVGAIRAIVEHARESDDGDKLLSVLRDGSPVREPLSRLFSDSDDDDGVVWFSRWLRREYTTSTQRMKLGLAGTIEGEGQAIHAVTDLMRVARAAGLVQVWFVMIDQLEELWREGVITPSRRARFLTDLRCLIDQSLEGAPVAILLAWNTTVSASSYSDVGSQIKADYHALWQRLGQPIDIPQLTREQVWPFAEEYLRSAEVRSSSKDGRKRLFDLLKAETKAVIEELDQESGRLGGSSLYSPRSALSVWRRKTDDVARRP